MKKRQSCIVGETNKVNRVIIHLHGLLTWYRTCASILYCKIGRSGFLTMKNVTALLSSVNIYKHWEVLLFVLSRFLKNFSLTWKSPMKVFFFCLIFSHKHKTLWNLLLLCFNHLRFRLEAGEILDSGKYWDKDLLLYTANFQKLVKKSCPYIRKWTTVFIHMCFLLVMIASRLVSLFVSLLKKLVCFLTFLQYQVNNLFVQSFEMIFWRS